MSKKKKVLLAIPGGLVLVLVLLCVGYLNDYYKADVQAAEVFMSEVEMPFRIAMFDMNAADGIRKQYPDITDWYIGGHSLGGSIAAMYLGEHHADYEGLILLGSYSTEDLSGTSLKVLSVYGSEDKVINYENYVESKSNLPADFTEVIIDGGNHAYFGMYGVQDGDGVPTISNEEQIVLTVDAVMEFVE